MSGAFIFAYFVLPFIVSGIGFVAYYLHARESDAELRARAEAERAKG